MSSSTTLKRAGRLGLALTILCLTIIPASACGGTVPPTEPIATVEPVTIKFSYIDDSVAPGYYETLAQEFSERHPHIAVDLRPEGWDDWDAAADPEYWTLRLHGMESILSLDPFIEQDGSFDLSDFYPNVVEQFTIDGQLWAIPYGVDLLVMYYNRDLFDQYGVPYPELGWTWDDFLSRAMALRDPGASVYGYAPWDDYLDSVSFVYQHGGRLVDDLQHPTRPTFDEPETIEALEWYADLIHKHDVAPTPKQARDDFEAGIFDPNVGVVAGKVGMWMGSLSDQGGDSFVEWRFDWGMAPLPRDVQPATLSWGWGYAIHRDTEEPEACWRWVVFLSERIPSRLVPGRVSLAESDEYVRSARDYATEQASLQNAVLISQGTLWTWGGTRREMVALESALREIGAGTSTPREAMTEAQRKAEEVTE
jgi:multiple sugar transport system substrate-binding protein